MHSEASDTGGRRSADRFDAEVAELARQYRDEGVFEWILSDRLRRIQDDIDEGTL